MLRNKICSPSTTYFNSPLILISNATTGRSRVCADMRELNKRLELAHFPLVTYEEMRDTLGAAQPLYFSSLDSFKGHHQLGVYPPIEIV